jgi:hypothetical protein
VDDLSRANNDDAVVKAAGALCSASNVRHPGNAKAFPRKLARDLVWRSASQASQSVALTRQRL